ncbi:DEAD/DEAH box helicase [Viridibacillus sp. YIM B01967]|uniref:DEAD/DEAH box helicase n=1 Tax=Viridibacillus soli TaxID=2798301 RepID=A0ABS1H604_9BACL|nr:DEAD/DEAH box helicase [Viridibacillus soli]MBK3494820.1 DEAD/DEAH box helicase [Viridibacillus soli]
MRKKLSKLQSNKCCYLGTLENPSIRDFLTGRIWLRDHSPYSEEQINQHIQLGFISNLPGVQKLSHTNYICNRCANKNPTLFIKYHCAACENYCVYCRHCISMGRVSSCSDLIKWIGPAPKKSSNHPFTWTGTFTPYQQKAANELIESIKENRTHLLHAVCGSGKTEILFPAIHECLKQGKRIAVATPRTDVVLELAPRLKQVFPNTNTQVLYGGAEIDNSYAPLVIATTHQLYRFENAFDIIIVDEADAFPYTHDETLQQAVIKAKKSSSPIMYVTATPSDKLLSQIKKQQGGYSFIPRRYHGKPLPVPRYDTLWRYTKRIESGKLPRKLINWTHAQIQGNRPFLIFFPTIALMEMAIPLFQQLDFNIQAVHAEDPDRKEKVLKLRAKNVPGLLTTTILERGITIPNVQVAVVGAESGIFTSSALIQIGGRVGRSFDCPTGDLVFFHHGISVEMDVARKEIRRLNQTELSTI